jgi:hypothetical protein
VYKLAVKQKKKIPSGHELPKTNKIPGQVDVECVRGSLWPFSSRCYLGGKRQKLRAIRVGCNSNQKIKLGSLVQTCTKTPITPQRDQEMLSPKAALQQTWSDKRCGKCWIEHIKLSIFGPDLSNYTESNC